MVNLLDRLCYCNLASIFVKMPEILQFNDQNSNPRRFFRNFYTKDFSDLRSRKVRCYDRRCERAVSAIEQKIVMELGEGVRYTHRAVTIFSPNVTAHDDLPNSEVERINADLKRKYDAKHAKHTPKVGTGSAGGVLP